MVGRSIDRPDSVGVLVPCLSDSEGDVAVLDHVLNLSSHYTNVSLKPMRSSQNQLTRQAKKNQPVNDQHRPEDGQVEDLKPAAEEANSNRLGSRVPKLELGQPADKRPELLVLLGRQAARIAVLHALILLERGVEFGRQEGEEEVQQVDAERVCDDVPALGEEDAQAEEQE